MTRAAVRKLGLVTHVTASVGWLGAVASALALALAAVLSADDAVVRGAASATETIARWVLVPLSLASLVTGVVQSLATPWGLVRHYWVLLKLLINVVAVGVLLLYLDTLDGLARLGADPSTPVAALRNPSPALHAALALVLLLAATVLGVYKPRGRTPFRRGAGS